MVRPFDPVIHHPYERGDYVGVPMHCCSCGTKRDGRNEWSHCTRLSNICGRTVAHAWVEDEDPFSPLQRGLPPGNLPSGRPENVLPTDSAERKNMPVYSGVIRYFPRALAYVAKISKSGNDKHNPGEPLHWSRDKSGDHLDCIARHLIDVETVDPEDGLLHAGKLAWRALANLELKLEAEEANHANSCK